MTLRITRDFGRELLAEHQLPLKGSRTAVSLLREHHDVGLQRDEGDYVREIDGLRSTYNVYTERSDETRWNFFVNGLKNEAKPTELPLSPGDVVQFDFEDLDGSFDVRASIGAFPEPFKEGYFGRRFPVELECLEDGSAGCDQVRRAFRAAGIDTSGRRPPQRPVTAEMRKARSMMLPIDRARIVVGTSENLRDHPAGRHLEQGPDTTGVFMEFGDDGRTIELLDWDAIPVRELGPGSGLVAAARWGPTGLTWIVTGTDNEGLERAASALDPETMRDAFAIAVTEDGSEKLPLAPPDDG